MDLSFMWGGVGHGGIQGRHGSVYIPYLYIHIDEYDYNMGL